MSEQDKPTTQQSVLSAIKAGQVKMKPKWQFLLQAILLIVGIVLVAIALLFVGSFIVFTLRQNGAWFISSFGGLGLKELAFDLPLIFIAVAIIFVLILLILVKRYSFSYGKPIIYTVTGLTIFVFLGSMLVSQTKFHEDLFLQARDNNLPLLGGFYRQFGLPEVDRIAMGEIVSVMENSFVMRTPRQRDLVVVTTQDTQLLGNVQIVPGTFVLVIGDSDGNKINAEGVRELEPRESLYPHQRAKNMMMESFEIIQE